MHFLRFNNNGGFYLFSLSLTNTPAVAVIAPLYCFEQFCVLKYSKLIRANVLFLSLLSLFINSKKMMSERRPKDAASRCLIYLARACDCEECLQLEFRLVPFDLSRLFHIFRLQEVKSPCSSVYYVRKRISGYIP